MRPLRFSRSLRSTNSVTASPTASEAPTKTPKSSNVQVSEKIACASVKSQSAQKRSGASLQSFGKAVSDVCCLGVRSVVPRNWGFWTQNVAFRRKMADAVFRTFRLYLQPEARQTALIRDLKIGKDYTPSFTLLRAQIWGYEFEQIFISFNQLSHPTRENCFENFILLSSEQVGSKHFNETRILLWQMSNRVPSLGKLCRIIIRPSNSNERYHSRNFNIWIHWCT